MQHSVKITGDGQMTLPEEVLKALGVGPGDRVDLVENADGTFALRPRSETFADLIGVFKDHDAVADEDITRWIEEARASMAMGSLDDRD